MTTELKKYMSTVHKIGTAFNPPATGYQACESHIVPAEASDLTEEITGSVLVVLWELDEDDDDRLLACALDELPDEIPLPERIVDRLMQTQILTVGDLINTTSDDLVEAGFTEAQVAAIRLALHDVDLDLLEEDGDD